MVVVGEFPFCHRGGAQKWYRFNRNVVGIAKCRLWVARFVWNSGGVVDLIGRVSFFRCSYLFSWLHLGGSSRWGEQVVCSFLRVCSIGTGRWCVLGSNAQTACCDGDNFVSHLKRIPLGRLCCRANWPCWTFRMASLSWVATLSASEIRGVGWTGALCRPGQIYMGSWWLTSENIFLETFVIEMPKQCPLRIISFLNFATVFKLKNTNPVVIITIKIREQEWRAGKITTTGNINYRTEQPADRRRLCAKIMFLPNINNNKDNHQDVNNSRVE